MSFDDSFTSWHRLVERVSVVGPSLILCIRALPVAERALHVPSRGRFCMQQVVVCVCCLF